MRRMIWRLQGAHWYGVYADMRSAVVFVVTSEAAAIAAMRLLTGLCLRDLRHPMAIE